MSSGAAIECQGLWKRFKRGARTDSVRDLVPATLRRLAGRRVPGREPFWAVEDVSFRVGPGEALGIIGPNGAGKSTILKLVSRILKPTRGTVRISGSSGRRGRVGALIEVAAGFHSELTGRENVFLQGAVMGMKRAAIRERFDQIVDFAEIESFIDTPVKRYSSGMTARLGFAVAAHLDPDVLCIDEILSVGDRSYQQKAFDRLRELVDDGIPTVVVSHQLGRVAGLCGRGLLLGHGQVRSEGPIGEVVAAYLSADSPDSPRDGSPIRLEAIHTPTPCVAAGERVRFSVTGAAVEGVALDRILIGVRVRSLPSYEQIFHTWISAAGIGGPFEMEAELQMNLGPGSYHVQPIVWRESKGRHPIGVARGPYVLVDVLGEPDDRDTVYLDPLLRVIEPPDPG